MLHSELLGDGTAPEMSSKSALLEDIRYVGIMDE